MANLTGSNFNNLKPGILNISTNDDPVSTGLPAASGNLRTVFVEDGLGVKSGLKLGAELAEAVDPVTRNGIVNVNFADRTYAKIADLKQTNIALELYRENLNRDFSDALEPIVDRVNTLELSLNTNQSLTESLSTAVTQLTTANLLPRLTDVESQYLSKLGGTYEGRLQFTNNATIDLGSIRIQNMANGVNPRDAVTVEQLQALEARITALENA